MTKNSLIRLWVLLIVPLPAIITGCDSGDIYPEDKAANGIDVDVAASFKFTHIDAFPENS